MGKLKSNLERKIQKELKQGSIFKEKQIYMKSSTYTHAGVFYEIILYN